VSRKIGFTTSIPVEILFAAGLNPCDLNNIFVTHADPLHFLELAERDGFPKSMCNWIKGLYGVVKESGIDTVIAVLEGDCSNTRALTEILSHRGVRTIAFSYPFDRDRESLGREIGKLKKIFEVDERMLACVEAGIMQVRQGLQTIDRMTWKDGLIRGEENHVWQVSASDMEGDYEAFARKIAVFTDQAKGRLPLEGIPLGYVGVPPITTDIYRFLEDCGCRITYNEVQRQFALPYDTGDLIDRYLLYTYPYGIFARVDDIRREIKRRKLAGIVHYVQAFCYRAIEDIILKEMLDVPVITIEGDLPKTLDTRTRLRLEAFVEMLKGQVDGEG
jgi:benzoyl-CoA reductase/2-hydroxyglutaryl-CoA dehydratase subunit BcrC/BadD/HgdB